MQKAEVFAMASAIATANGHPSPADYAHSVAEAFEPGEPASAEPQQPAEANPAEATN